LAIAQFGKVPYIAQSLEQVLKYIRKLVAPKARFPTPTESRSYGLLTKAV